MGDPRRSTQKYSTPLKRWDKARIDIENKLVIEYGLKNKKEIWKANFLVHYLIGRVKNLSREKNSDAEGATSKLLGSIKARGFLPQDAKLEAVLALNNRNILDRRLQSIVYKRGLANSVKQARQLITHRHITIAGRVVNIPSYLVPLEEEHKIEFKVHSPFAQTDHPERVAMTKKSESPKKVKEPRKVERPRRFQRRRM
jgi:small subunit ribosomal protein S4